MNALSDDLSAPTVVEKVTHVAFRCGCTRSLKEADSMLGNCPIHKEIMTSFMEEMVPVLVRVN